MNWVIVRGGAILYRGPYRQCLDAAESYSLVARSFHPDGTELAPRLAPGVHLLLEDMIPARMRRRAA